MRIWKNIFRIILILSIVFIVAVIFFALSTYTSKSIYPYPVLEINISNWFEKFYLIMGLTLYIIGISLIVNQVLLIISDIKTNKYKNRF